MAKVFLNSKDGKKLEVDRTIAMKWGTIRNILQDLQGDNPEIPVPEIYSSILEKIVEHTEHHKNDPIAPSQRDRENNKDRENKEEEKRTDDIMPWDLKFCEVDKSTVYQMLMASNYLDYRPLLDLTCKTIANWIKGKTPSEIRELLEIKNDFTPEEEEKIREDHAWCEER